MIFGGCDTNNEDMDQTFLCEITHDVCKVFFIKYSLNKKKTKKKIVALNKVVITTKGGFI